MTPEAEEALRNAKIGTDVPVADTGLVLEGGGMRGIFTIGVLDAFMARGLRFPYVIGVSAGGCNGCSYVSRQPGRAHFSNVTMMQQYDYIGIRHLLRQGNIFDVKLLYDRLPNEIYPFNYDEFFSTPIKFEVVTTNCNTGKAEYYSSREDKKRTMDIILATSTLPYVGKIIPVDGKPMLDGGITDSIPVRRAMEQGYENNVVVLTRNKGYRKPIKHGRFLDLLGNALRWIYYRRYPRLMDALKNRGEIYNAQLELVERLESEGKIKVVRPEKPIVVDRIEKNVDKLQALYEEGYRIGMNFKL